MKKFVFFCILLFILSAKDACANVVINEFSSGTTSDWVELYNTSTESADLANYKLMDSGSNDKTLSGTISGGGFLSFSFSNWLNNSTADGVRLFKAGDLIDSIFYGGDGQICFAISSQTIGRSPDGTGSFVLFSTPTRDAANSSGVSSCPTPTPSSSPTSAPTSTPTKTSTPTPTILKTLVPVSTNLPKTTPETSPEVLGLENTPLDLLAVRNTLNTPSDTPKGSEVKSSSFPVLGLVLIVLGIGFIGTSIYLVLRKPQKIPDTINE